MRTYQYVFALALIAPAWVGAQPNDLTMPPIVLKELPAIPAVELTPVPAVTLPPVPVKDPILTIPPAPGEVIPLEIVPPQSTPLQNLKLTNPYDPSSQPAPGTDAAAKPAAEGAGKSDNGTNPAANITTMIVENDYYYLEGGSRINTLFVRQKFPIYDGRGSLLFEVPYVYYDFQAFNPRVPEIGGLGDIKAQFSYNTWTSEDKKLTMINFMEIFLPTADNALLATPTSQNQLTAFNLGTGKFVLGPGVGFVYMLQPNFLIAPLYFYEFSAFGNQTRPTISRGKLRFFAMYAWECGLYVLPEFQLLSNFMNDNNDAYFAPEVGYSTKGTTLFVKSGIGISPQTNDREWGLAFGARIQF